MTRTLTTFRGAAGFDATADKVKVHEAFMGSDGTAPFEGVIGLEGMLTGDGRLIQEQSLSWAQFPLPLRWAPADFGAHDGALVVGRIDRIERRDNGDIYAWGVLDLGSKEGRECARLMRGQFLSGVSMDLDSVDSFEAEVQMFDADGNPQGEVGDRPNVLVTSEARVRAATLVAIPAFDEARLALVASIGSSPGIMVGHGAFSLTFADDAADRAAFRAGAAREWSAAQDRLAAMAEFAPRTRLFNELAAARQTFAGNLGYLKQWRNPDNGKWIDMPGTAIGKLIAFFKQHANDNATPGDNDSANTAAELEARKAEIEAALANEDLPAAQKAVQGAIDQIGDWETDHAGDAATPDEKAFDSEGPRDALDQFMGLNDISQVNADAGAVDVGDIEGADFEDPATPAAPPAQVGGDTGIQATLNELDGMPNRGAGAWVRINDPDLRGGSGVFEYDDVDDEFVNTDGDGTSFLASNKNVAALEKRGGSIDILGWPDGDGGYTPAPPGAAKDSIDAGGLGENGTGLSEVERTSLQSYLEGITDDELQSHYDKTAKLRGDKPSGTGLQLKLDDELALAGDELVKRGLETNESLDERLLGPNTGAPATDGETPGGAVGEGIKSFIDENLAWLEPQAAIFGATYLDEVRAKADTDYLAALDNLYELAGSDDANVEKVKKLMVDLEGEQEPAGTVADSLPAGTPIFNTGMDAESQQVSYVVGENGSLIASDENGEVDYGVPVPDPATGAAAMDAVGLRADDLQEDEVWEGMRDDGTLVAVIKHGGTLYVGGGTLDTAADPAAAPGLTVGGEDIGSPTAISIDEDGSSPDDAYLGIPVFIDAGFTNNGDGSFTQGPVTITARPDGMFKVQSEALGGDYALFETDAAALRYANRELGDAGIVPGTGGLNAEQTATVDAGLQAMNPLAEETAQLPATDKEIMAEGDGIELDERATWDPAEWGGATYDETVFDAEGIAAEVRKLPNWANASDEGVQRYVEDRRRYWEAEARTEPAKDNETGVPMRLLPTGSEVHVPAAAGRAYYRKVGAPIANGNSNPDGTPEIVGKWWDGYQWDFVGGSTLFETGRIPVGKAPDKKWKAENDKAAAIAQARADYAEAHAADPGTPLPVNDTPDGPDAMLDAEEAEHRGRVGNPPGTGIVSPEDTGEGAPNNGGIPTAPNGETRKEAMQPLVGETVTVHDPNDGPFEVDVVDVRGTGDAGPYKTLDSAAETARKYPASIKTPEGNWIPLSMVEAGTLVTPAASPPGTGKVSPEGTGEEAEAAIEALDAPKTGAGTAETIDTDNNVADDAEEDTENYASTRTKLGEIRSIIETQKPNSAEKLTDLIDQLNSGITSADAAMKWLDDLDGILPALSSMNDRQTERTLEQIIGDMESEFVEKFPELEGDEDATGLAAETSNPFADASVPIPWSKAAREDDSIGISRVTYRVPGWDGFIRQDGRPFAPFTVYWEGDEGGSAFMARSLSEAKAEVEGALRRGKLTADTDTFAMKSKKRKAKYAQNEEDCGCDELAEGGVQTFAGAVVETVAETWRNIDGTQVPLPGIRLTELLTALAGIQVPVGSVERARAYTDQLDTALIDGAWEVVNRLTPDFYASTGALFQAYLNTTGTDKFPTAQEAFEALEACVETAAETASELALEGFEEPEADAIAEELVEAGEAGEPGDPVDTGDDTLDEAIQDARELGPNDAGAPALPVIEVVAPAALAADTATTAYNWVEETGGLPRYIRRIADHLIERGMTESHAIASAVNTVKRWSRGGGDVKPDTIAKSLAALAEWEAKKIAAHATSAQSVTFAVIEAPVKPAFVEGFDTLEGVEGGQDLVNDIAAVSSAVLTVANDVAEAVGLLPEGTRAEGGHDLSEDVDSLEYVAAQVEATSRKVAGSLIASAGGTYAAPIAPPKAWFANPNLKTATPVTVTPEGRIYGHLATWDSCHMESKGLGTTCTRAPKSRSGYALFHTGYVTTAEGDDVPTGRIVAGAPHADPVWGFNPTLVHYSHSGWVGADVRVGEDAYGIWVSGAIRPDVSPAQLRALKAAPLSGDWREDPKTGQLELVAGLGVTVPGFMPRPRGLVASAGSVLSMQAVGMVAPSIVIPPGKDGAFSIEDLRYLQQRAVAGKAWAAEATKVAEFARARAVDNIAAFALERKMTEMAADVKGMR